MAFEELIERVRKLKFEEKRAQAEGYFELVVSKDDLAPILSVLGAYFGTPIKPGGQHPSGEANRHAKPFGGIRQEQTMYFRAGEELSEYALLWPWGSGARVTVKIIQTKASKPGFFAKLFGRKS